MHFAHQSPIIHRMACLKNNSMHASHNEITQYTVIIIQIPVQSLFQMPLVTFYALIQNLTASASLESFYSVNKYSGTLLSWSLRHQAIEFNVVRLEYKHS